MTKRICKEAMSPWRTQAPRRLPILYASSVLFCAALFGCAALPAAAEEPLWGEIASTLGKGFVNVSTNGAYRAYRPFRHHGSAVALTMTQVNGSFLMEYGLTPDADVRVRLPYFNQTMEEEFAGQTASHSMSGMGEMTVGVKRRLWQDVGKQHKNELAVFGDVKLPTGDNNLRDANGALIPPHLQPNTGNYGGSAGLAANRHTDKGGHWFSTMYTAEARSSRFQRGSMMEIHASSGRRVRRLKEAGQTDWMGIVGLHYYRMGQDSENGQSVEGSGGSVVSAELSLLGSRQTRGFRLGILVPVHVDLGPSHAPPRHELQASFRGSF
jgi:hypothetical protein